MEDKMKRWLEGLNKVIRYGVRALMLMALLEKEIVVIGGRGRSSGWGFFGVSSNGGTES